MPYQLPTFNLNCNIWHGEDPSVTWPLVRVPDVISPCNLFIGLKFEGGAPWNMHLGLPALTDVRDESAYVGTTIDVVEVPAGTGRWYSVEIVEDVGKGFANEYRIAGLLKLWVRYPGVVVWPVPIP